MFEFSMGDGYLSASGRGRNGIQYKGYSRVIRYGSIKHGI